MKAVGCSADYVLRQHDASDSTVSLGIRMMGMVFTNQ